MIVLKVTFPVLIVKALVDFRPKHMVQTLYEQSWVHGCQVRRDLVTRLVSLNSDLVIGWDTSKVSQATQWTLF